MLRIAGGIAVAGSGVDVGSLEVGGGVGVGTFVGVASTPGSSVVGSMVFRRLGTADAMGFGDTGVGV